MIYLAKLVKIYCFSLLPVLVDLVNRDYENSAVCVACRCELDNCYERVQTSGFSVGDRQS